MKTKTMHKKDYKKYINSLVKPGENFHEFATGKWLFSHPQPSDWPVWNTFGVLEEESLNKLKSIVNGLDASDFIQRKILDYKYVYTNYEKRNKEGVTPFMKYLSALDSLQTKDEIMEFAIDEMICPFSLCVSIGPDEKDSLNNVVYMSQDLALDNKEYYLSDEEHIKDIIAKYIEVGIKIITKFGYTEERAWDITRTFLDFEADLAMKANSMEDLEIPELNYFKYNVEELSKECDYDIKKFLAWHTLDETEEVVVCHPEFTKEFFRKLNEITVDELREIVRFVIIEEYAASLSEDFGEISFEFEKFVTGAKERTPRWKRELMHLDSEFSEIFGEIYAKKYFNEQSKEYAIDMFNNIRNSFAEIIKTQSWMSDETKEIAVDKLYSMTYKIGYPDKWKDYSDLPVDTNLSYLENVIRISNYWKARNIEERYNKPVDLTEWPMLPQDINACYMPLRNEFCFPCGILQSPFFDIEQDDAVNYGAIGMIMAHEMTHGFDRSGRKFTKEGNLCDWWKEEDAKKFEELSQNTIDQFNKLDAIEGDMKANGTLTVNENIADFGGITIAYNALKKIMELNEDTDDEYNWKQRFFIAYAVNWAGIYTEEAKRDYTLNGTHSLVFNRVNGTLPMVNEWYDAFHITEEDPMYVEPEKRGKVWAIE